MPDVPAGRRGFVRRRCSAFGVREAMFDTLSDRLTGVFDRLRGRSALLEADVALPVARKFIDAVTEKAVGQSVLRSVTPGQQVVKIVNDELVEMLGGPGYENGEAAPLVLEAKPPVVI